MISGKTYRSLYRTFFPLLLVIAAQGIVSLGVNLADNLMLGSYSELSMSGASVVNQLQYVLQSLTSGVGAGIVALCSQYWGKGETEPIRRIVQLGVKLSLLVGALFCALTLAFPYQTLRLLASDEAVIAEGVRYLKLMCWTYIIFALSSSLAFSLQSVQTAWIGSVMSVSTLVINICLNYVFIFGNLGAPRLGVTGAAIATLTSRCVELVIILVYVLCVDKKLRLKLSGLIRPDFGYLRDFLKVSLPVIAGGAQWGVANAAQAAILGHMSATAIAANSIAGVVFSIFTVFGFSCSSAAQITVGKLVGEGDYAFVKRCAGRLQLIFLLIGLFTGIMLFTFRQAIVGLYDVSEAARSLALQFLIVLSVSTVGTCYEFPVSSGIITGGGNTKYAAIVDTAFMWLFTLPASAASAFLLGWSPIVTFCVLKSDQLLKCIPNLIYVNRCKWIKKLTREN